MKHQESIDSILCSTQLNWPEAYETMSPAILRMVRVHHGFNQTLESAIGQYQLQVADFGILVTLRRYPAPYCLSPTTLYSAMLFSSGGLTKVLNRVTQAGLIERVDNPEDKRSKLVQLTTAGKTLIDKVVIELHLQQQRRMAVLTSDEQAQLNHLLSKLGGR
ncbi:MarR family winged helix-turn-helix transcriptional regulator [Agarivorans sp. 1_MG-2023]|uniref:MarR family winged helix-turn-helix transcriptional regulator n=1 Tax=Agarivorans sp. 1_MG-2023 TaxID=3062634 RepID=UPI0026E46BC9|nr:MarR family transcriptional regulator [Agarivorans sp. 1_MG-2023]MDO6762226.1 MarR family transcriptional regulator [Agarivorans sp. 1_MG-2023]